jgi:hypothetical protein
MWNGMKKSGDMKRKKQFDPSELTCYLDLAYVNRNLNLNLLLNAPLTGAAAGF